MSLSNGKQLLSPFFSSQLWLWPARPHGDPLGRAQCICLGVQHPLKRWCCRLRIDSMGPNISAAKTRRSRIFFFFFGIVSVQCQAIMRIFVSTALQNLRYMGWYCGLTSQEPAQFQWNWTMKQSSGENKIKEVLSSEISKLKDMKPW